MTKNQKHDLDCCQGLCCELDSRGLAYVFYPERNKPLILTAQETHQMALKGHNELRGPASYVAFAVGYFNRWAKKKHLFKLKS